MSATAPSACTCGLASCGVCAPRMTPEMARQFRCTRAHIPMVPAGGERDAGDETDGLRLFSFYVEGDSTGRAMKIVAHSRDLAVATAARLIGGQIMRIDFQSETPIDAIA